MDNFDWSIISQPFVETWQTLTDVVLTPQGLLLIGLVAFIYLFNLFSPRNQQITSGEFAGRSDKAAAIKRANKQIKSSDADEVCLWCGTPSGWQQKLGQLWALLIGSAPTVYVPDANRSAVVIGKAGSGKTFSVIDPMVRSAIEQNHPVVLYDYKADEYGKGGQIEYLATLAARYQYNVQIFAPGRDYSCVINPLDFLDGPDDSTTAGTLAEVFHQNLTKGGGKQDAFFGPAGQRLIQGLLQYAKHTNYPDLAMAFCLVQLPDLAVRLAYAAEERRLPYFVQVTFSQFISAGASDKTSSGILATASDVLTRFIAPDLLPSLLGKTNISPILQEREMLVFQSDIFRQDVVNPLLAAIINVVVNLNCSVQRDHPLIFSADEFPTIYMPQAPRWPNEHRSKGFTGIFGFQSFPQIVESYGEQNAKALLSSCSTRFWFNPGDSATAKSYTDELGEEEVLFKTRSFSRSFGESRSRNRSTSEQVRTKPLVQVDEIMRFDVGECIYINPAYNQKPIHYDQLPIPSDDVDLKKDCEGMWESVRDRMIRRERNRRPDLNMEEQIRIRLDEAERLLPMPPDPDNPGANTSNKNGASNKPGNEAPTVTSFQEF